MRFKIKVKQVIKPYETKEFEIDAYNALMAIQIFETTHPEYTRPEFHITAERRETERMTQKEGWYPGKGIFTARLRPVILPLNRLFDMQDQLIEHKFPHEKAQVMDNIISYAGDVYREMAGGVYRHAPHFGYVYEKWENLAYWGAAPPRGALQEGDWEEFRKQVQDPTYRIRRDEYLRKLQVLKGATEKTSMELKRKAIMIAALDMIEALIEWFESLNPVAAPKAQLDKLTDAIGNYFPQFWEE